MFDSQFEVVADLGELFPAFLVYVFGAKRFSLIVVSNVFALFPQGCFVPEWLHI
jgi:hypothetical protein